MWEAARKVPSVTHNGIYQCLASEGLNRARTCGGFVWQYVPDQELKDIVVTVPRGRGHIVQSAPDGTEINRYASVEKAARAVRVGRPNMKKALADNTICQGFMWTKDSASYRPDLLEGGVHEDA